MKNVIVMSAIVFLSIPHHAVKAQEVRLVSADGSALSALCIAATRSEDPLYKIAQQHGIAGSEIEEIRCNGIALPRFASMYKARNTASLHNQRYRNGNTRTTSSLQ